LYWEEKISFRRYKKSKSDQNYSAFSYYGKMVKTTIKRDRLLWLNNLETKPKHFWKYVSKFKKINHVVTQLIISYNTITESQCIVEDFADHFYSIFNSPSSVVIPDFARFMFSDFFKPSYDF
jgi:hypothetical protein